MTVPVSGMMHDPPPVALPPSADIVAIIEAALDQRPADPKLVAQYFAPDAVAAREQADVERRASDWPAFSRYRTANRDVSAPNLVMIGDSLTEIWGLATPDLFDGTIVNRGIPGQTSPQILLRFMADVVELSPTRVHRLCGTNDIAGNTGPSTPEDYQRTVRAMALLATGSGIDVLIGSIPPAANFPWQPEARPRDWIPHLNAWLRDFARQNEHGFIDYHPALDDGTGALSAPYSADGVHVSRAAYVIMSRLLREAIAAQC